MVNARQLHHSARHQYDSPRDMHASAGRPTLQRGQTTHSFFLALLLLLAHLTTNEVRAATSDVHDLELRGLGLWVLGLGFTLTTRTSQARSQSRRSEKFRASGLRA